MDLSKFRALYPQFDSTPDMVVEMLYDHAKLYVPDACCNAHLLWLMVAHLCHIRTQIATGGGTAVSSASEGSVSVTLAQPANVDARALWLNSTPFGQEYAAALEQCIKSKAAAGIYIGNLPEQAGFRKAGGVF